MPRISHPSAVPYLRLRVAPIPAATAGSIMTPRLDSNFASSDQAADESSCPIGSCTFPSDSGCILNLNPAFHRRTSRLCTAEFNRVLHLPARLELRFQFPTGSPTVLEIRPVQSVEASAKNRLICGFHKSWCNYANTIRRNDNLKWNLYKKDQRQLLLR